MQEVQKTPWCQRFLSLHHLPSTTLKRELGRGRQLDRKLQWLLAVKISQATGAEKRRLELARIRYLVATADQRKVLYESPKRYETWKLIATASWIFFAASELFNLLK